MLAQAVIGHYEGAMVDSERRKRLLSSGAVQLTLPLGDAAAPPSTALPERSRPRTRRVLKAPAILDLIGPQNIEPTLGYIAKIRRAALMGDRPVYVDLSDCQQIGMVGCMMLAAEIDRCRAEKPNCITGCDPNDPSAKAMLEAFGFHQLLGFRPENSAPSERFVRMQSGRGADPKLAEQLGQVAALAMRVWGDQAFADRVHAALNEAITNVIMHAYPDSAPGQGQWWIAGAADVEAKVAYFLAMDHGVSIPATAIHTMQDLLLPYKATYPTLPDNIVLLATIKGGRTQTHLPQHGKGLGAMIGLVENLSRGGGVWIYSAGGQYAFAVGDTDAIDDAGQITKMNLVEPVEISQPLPQRFPGTLVVWRVDGPKGLAHEE